MEDEILKINTLVIAISGLALTACGFFLYFYREAVAPYMRFLLPIPPIAVAAYVYVFNMYRKYGGHLPNSWVQTTWEIVTATLYSSLIFAAFTAALVFIVDAVKN